MVVFLFTPLKFAIRTWVHNIFAYLALSLSASQVYMIQERCWFSKSTSLLSTFNIGSRCCFFPANFSSHSHTQIRIILFHDERRDIPNLEFSPIHVSIGFSQIAFPIIVQPKDDHTDSFQVERLGLPYWTMILAICVVVVESKCLDTPILEFPTICEHLPFSIGY